MVSARLGWSLVLAGLGLGVVGGVILYRRHRQLLFGEGLGRDVKKFSELPPVISTTSAGGMVVQHRRSRDLPIGERVACIQDLVFQSIHDPEMIALARQITHLCPERDGECEARAIYDAVKARVRYTGDIGPVKLGRDGPVEAIDLFQSAKRTWQFRGGDCDDHSILIATLLALNGLTAKLRVTASSKFEDWSHIYVVVALPKFSPKKMVPVDTTLPGKNRFGYEVPFSRNLDYSPVRHVADHPV